MRAWSADCSTTTLMRNLALLVVLVTACGTSIKSTTINPSPRPMYSRPAETVELFTSGAPNDRRFVDIAYLEAEQDSEYSWDDTPEFLKALRERGAQMGCDGVVVGSPTNRVTTDLVDDRPANIKGVVATCIMFLDPADAALARR
jgi:hypothetical protein